MRTTIVIPDGLADRIEQYNDRHPEQKIIIGQTCRIALELKMDELDQIEYERRKQT